MTAPTILRRSRRLPRRTATALALAASLALAATGCGVSFGDGGDDGGGSEKGTITVYAAASLSKTFPEIAKRFEARHKGVTVRFSFGGSSDLVEQIKNGAPADVFASADTTTMDKLGSQAVQPRPFATNVLEIAVPPGNPAKIETFADLAKPGVKTVVCAPEVPCGSATEKVEKLTGVTLSPVSEEQAVTDVLGKVSSGEADAGVVYVTDVKGAGDSVEGVDFPEADKVVNTYPIAPLKDSKHAKLARDFVYLTRHSIGQKILSAAGFGAP